MENDAFCIQLSNDVIAFTDIIKKDTPYISSVPRNHESLFFVTNGSLLYESENTNTIINHGQVGYIARGSVDKSSAYKCDSVSYIALNFSFDKENMQPVKTLPFKVLCSTCTIYNYKVIFNNILNSFFSKTPGYNIICNGILMQIIGLLYNEYKFDKITLQNMLRIEKAIEYLKNHYDDSEFKISDMAKLCNMSEKNFRHIFFSVYKKKPYDFLQQFRIDKAEILLSGTSKSISEIAVQCGFSDIYSFSHCFKNHFGTSPNIYRCMNK